ncbi:MAG: hypothetical protein KDD47_02015 [Acidobacteria bacterium]|nr:hypothetical protein [Acidobacteriota bacterium]
MTDPDAGSSSGFYYAAPERPRLVKALAVSHALVLLGLAFLLSLPRSSKALAVFFGGSEAAVLTILLAVAAGLVASAYGLWAGRPWGWWVAASLYVYICLNAAFGVAWLASLPETSEGRRLYLSLRTSSRALGTALFLALLFQPKILSWCDLATDRRGGRFLRVLALGLLLAGLSAGWMYLSEPPAVE